MGDPEKFSASAYDVSETAFKQLYSEIDDIRSDELMMKIIKETDEPAEPDADARVDFAARAAPLPVDKNNERDQTKTIEIGAVLAGPTASKALVPSTPTPSIDRALVTRTKAGPPAPARRRRPIQMIVLAAAALAAIAFLYQRSQPDNLVRNWLATAIEPPPPRVTGLLHVADLAAGYTIKARETYGVDIPPGVVRIAVMSGQVKLANSSADLQRPCSSDTFVVEVKEGRRVSAGPFISSCGDAPAFIQAVIPQPALPADPIAPPGEK